MVVVVRNVAAARELESLLPAGAACGSIVTCAAALQRRPGSHDVWLTSLDAQAIVRRCGYLPGLIVKIGSLLASHPDWDLAYVARLLREDSWTL